MTQPPDMSEMDDYYERTRRPLFKRPQSTLGKLGCNLLILAWFLLLLLPFAMVWLAFGNTITLPRTNIPEPELHPLFRIQLVMEIDNRGLQFTTTDVVQPDNLNLCVENNINYLLWKSDDTASSAVYCQCYQRTNPESDWEFAEQIENACHNP